MEIRSGACNFKLFEFYEILLHLFCLVVHELRKPVIIQHMASRMEARVNSEYKMSCGAAGL